jgi:hypothetical protein
MIRERQNLTYHSNDGKSFTYPIKEVHNGY